MAEFDGEGIIEPLPGPLQRRGSKKKVQTFEIKSPNFFLFRWFVYVQVKFEFFPICL
jgi:hypothetical protein